MKQKNIKNLLTRSGLFNADWYKQRYQDVEITKMPPLDHFIKYGLPLNRNPSNEFDSRWYQKYYFDVSDAGAIPLIHFIRHGCEEGRKTRRLSDRYPNFDKTPGKRYPLRFLKTWDKDRERYFLEKIKPVIRANKEKSKSILASIVMPSYNRADIISEAIKSVQAQEHENFELLIIDDGSTDDTETVVKSFSKNDPRILYLRGKHRGVSAARNIGLSNASGDYIFYLDTDNSWSPNHLSILLTFMNVFDVPVAYTGLICEKGKNENYYRGDDFNWNRCHELNYLDMNSFAHKASVLELCGKFDENLKRLVDWDFMLRLTKIVRTVFLPVISVRYFDGDQYSRITKTVAIDGGIFQLEDKIRIKSKRIQSVEEVDENRYPIVESFFHAQIESKAQHDQQRLVASNSSVFPNLDSYQELEILAENRDKHLISIVIVCFNKSQYTRDCIESIFSSSTNKDFNIEVIVVDNGSTDDTREVVKGLAEKYQEISYIHNPSNMMFSMGNNIGAAHSRGSYIVFLNNDTIVTSGWLTKLHQKIDGNEQIGVVGPKLLYPDNTIQCAGIVFNEHSSMPYHIYRGFPRDEECVNKCRQYQALTGACMMMRAVDFFRIQGFDPDFVNGCEDIDFCLKFSRQVNKKICYVPESEIYHYEGKTEGRGKYISYNRELLWLKWGKITADDKYYYSEDGFIPFAYEKKGAEEHGVLAAYSPILRPKTGSQINPGLPESQKVKLLNVGFVSIWHVRGISIHTLQLTKALECEQIKTHIFARWESDKFANNYPVHHPRVLNAGDDPSADELLRWCNENDISVLVFMETHPKDWKRVEKAKAAGIKVICYENLDILRNELITNYEVFDGFLFNTFFTRDVMLGFFPRKPSITIPWGIEAGEQVTGEQITADGPLRFIHVAGWGGVNNRKNTGLLVEAFDAAGEIDAELYLYSQSPVSSYGEAVEQICTKNNRIHVHEGTIEDISEVYKGKDMLLWPSKREGVGLPILEALINGLPVLIADGYMMKQWIKPGIHGVVCPATPIHGQMYLPEMNVNSDELAMLIKNLADDREMVKVFAENVSRDRLAWQWDWQKGLIKKLFLRFSVNLQDPTFYSINYLPKECLEFEAERRSLFGEPGLSA